MKAPIPDHERVDPILLSNQATALVNVLNKEDATLDTDVKGSPEGLRISYRGVRTAMAATLLFRRELNILDLPEFNGDMARPIAAADMRQFLMHTVARASGMSDLPSVEEWQRNRLIRKSVHDHHVQLCRCMWDIAQTEQDVEAACAADDDTLEHIYASPPDPALVLETASDWRNILTLLSGGFLGARLVRRLAVVPDERLPYACVEARRLPLYLRGEYNLVYGIDRILDILCRIYGPTTEHLYQISEPAPK